MLKKYFNNQYTGAIPTHTGDRYYSQDMVRDFWFHMDSLGMAFEDIMGLLPILLSGGVVTQGGGLNLNITIGYGYAKFNVEIPDSFASTPPSKTTEDIEAIRISWAGQSNINATSSNCSIYTVVDDGATVQYVKIRYLEVDGNTRNRAKASLSYAYEITPSFDLIVDAVAPTDYDILLATFTSAAGVYTITSSTTHTLDRSSIESLNDYSNASVNVLTKTASYPILDSDFNGYTEVLIYANGNGAVVTTTLPTLADNIGKIVTVKVIDDSNLCKLEGEGAETIDGMDEIELPKTGDHLTVIAEATEWRILNENITCQLRLDTWAGLGSTDNKIIQLTNSIENVGNMFSENHSTGYAAGAEGLEITINKSGKYSFVCSWQWSGAGAAQTGWSLNSAQLTTIITSITTADLLAMTAANGSVGVDFDTSVWVGYLIAGDIVRLHGEGSTLNSLKEMCATYLGS